MRVMRKSAQLGFSGMLRLTRLKLPFRCLPMSNHSVVLPVNPKGRPTPWQGKLYGKLSPNRMFLGAINGTSRLIPLPWLLLRLLFRAQSRGKLLEAAVTILKLAQAGSPFTWWPEGGGL